MATGYEEKNDAELLLLLNGRDRRAFTEIYDRYWQVLFAHAFRMLEDRDRAADIVQELFITLWNRAGDLNLHQGLKPYLYIAIRNRTLKEIHQGKRRIEFVKELSQVGQEGESITEDTISFREFSRLVEAEVERLPPKMQQVFRKSRMDALSHREIAKELNISENSVKTTINRALKVLRSKLTLFFCLILYFFLKFMYT